LSSAQGAAQTIVKKASAYAAEGTSGLYPTTFGTLTSAASSTSYAVPSGTVTQLTTVPSSAPSSPNSIMFYTCGSGAGVKVGYWDFVANAAVSTATTFTAGDVSGTCSLATT